jgi:hypothetical protein
MDSASTELLATKILAEEKHKEAGAVRHMQFESGPLQEQTS